MANNNFLINIAYWNANGIQNKIHEFYDYMSTHHIHIACLNETHLKPSTKIHSHPNFIVYRNDSIAQKCGGVAIIINKSVKCKLLPHVSTSTIENISIEIISESNEKINFISIYIPPKVKNPKQLIISDLRKLTAINTSFFICGDFNARHRDWNCYRANPNGTVLQEFISNNKFLLKHPHQFTRFPYDRRSKPSTIDLVLTNGLHEMSEFSCTTMSSDHVAINFSIHTRSTYQKPRNTDVSYNFLLADWDLYRHVIQYHSKTTKKLEDINRIEDVDALIESFTKIIEHAKQRAIPKSANFKFSLMITDDIKNLIKYKNSLRRRWQVTRDPGVKTLLNYVENDVSKRIAELRNNCWQHKLQNIAADNKAVWATHRLLKNRNRALPPLINGDATILPTSDKAELFAKTFSNNHNNPLNSNNPEFTQRIHEMSTLPFDINPHNIDFCDEEELHSIIKRLKNKKAPGVDGINNRLLKNLPNNALKYLCLIINGCLKLQHFPANWKIAKVIPLHKTGKPANLPGSYRPISLLSSISKLLERIILARLNDHVTTHSILPDEQHGFRTNHSTTHQLHSLINRAKEGLSEGKSTGIICMDVSKAFDLVWHDGLIHKLRQLNFPHYLIAIIRNFLTNRSFFVSIGLFVSQTHPILAGLPQGCVISPILYNIFTHDIPKHANTTLSLFADDTAFHTTHTRVSEILKPLREHAKMIGDFMNRWKININSDKTQAIYVTRRISKEIPKKTITLFNKPIKWSMEIKYLGVLLDKRVTMKNHVDYAIRKVNIAIHLLYPLLSRNSKLNVQNKLLLYKMAIRPLLTYASPSFYHHLAQSHKKRLQIAQNKCLKLCMDLSIRTRTTEIHQMAQLPILDEFIFKLSDKFTQTLNN